MKIAVLKESEAGERRVAATPETVKKYVGLGASVAVETGAGDGASIADHDYVSAGAIVGPRVKSSRTPTRSWSCRVPTWRASTGSSPA